MDAAHGNPRLKAVAYSPRARRGQTIGTSARFDSSSGPDSKAPEDVAKAASLVSALKGAGWEEVGLGAEWYSHRFVWRREGVPPRRIETVPTEAGQAP